jgi:hypothetical protein
MVTINCSNDIGNSFVRGSFNAVYGRMTSSSEVMIIDKLPSEENLEGSDLLLIEARIRHFPDENE